jgi:hypothetical protein
VLLPKERWPSLVRLLSTSSTFHHYLPDHAFKKKRVAVRGAQNSGADANFVVASRPNLSLLQILALVRVTIRRGPVVWRRLAFGLSDGACGVSLCDTGQRATDGVPDMTAISDIDVEGVNVNLRVRFERDEVSVSNHGIAVAIVSRLFSTAPLIAWCTWVVLLPLCTARSVGASVRWCAFKLDVSKQYR